MQADARSSITELYLDLLKKCLTRYLFAEGYQRIEPRRASLGMAMYTPVRKLLAWRGMELILRVPFDAYVRSNGSDWPAEAETMIGLKRLDNLQFCAKDVIEHQVPGDFIETGVWRGGATIFMRALLQAYGASDRTVWVADSFEGLPKPDSARYPADAGDQQWRNSQLAISLEEVKANFERYGLLDNQVQFLAGWFQDSLPRAPIESLAILRLDGDMYGSTMQALTALYSKVSRGGYVIVDDYGAVPGCRQSVEDFRRQEGITDPLHTIDWTGVFWQRGASRQVLPPGQSRPTS